ncbi:DUF2339 domain-containing protein [Corynebacterium sp. CCM 9204]|uniref:DUF2339 domain-containing protein n=1 Tax=Corynebacterium sp. CCM 9204 TaxID=3057616 RepID=UPI0035258A9D
MPAEKNDRKDLVEALVSLTNAEQAVREARTKVQHALDGIPVASTAPISSGVDNHASQIPLQKQNPFVDGAPATGPVSVSESTPVVSPHIPAVRSPEPRSASLPRVPADTQDPWWRSENAVIRLLAIGGTLITLGGVALLVVLAAQSGLLGPLSRVLLAYLLAVGLGVGAAVARNRLDDRAQNTQTIVSAFLVTALLTALTTTWFVVFRYEWWPGWVGSTFCMALFLLLSITCARKWRMELTGIVLTIGASIFALHWSWWQADMAFTSAEWSWPSSLPGLLLLLVTFGLGWPRARITASVCVIGGALFSSLNILRSPVDVYLSFGVAIIVSLVFTAAVLYDRVPTSATAEKLASAWTPLLVLFLVFSNFFALEGRLPSALYWAPFVLLVLMAAAGYRSSLLPHPTGRCSPAHFVAPTLITVGTAAAPVSLLLVDFQNRTKLDYNQPEPAVLAYLPVAFLAFAILAVPAMARLHSGNAPWIAWALMTVIFTALPATMVFGQGVDSLRNILPLTEGVLIAILLCIIPVARKQIGELSVQVRILLALAGLHLSTVAVVTVSTFLVGIFGNAELGFLLGHAAVSILWIALAAYVLLGAHNMNAQASLGAGTLLAGAGTAKLILVDLGTISGVPRVFAFLVSGIALLSIAAFRTQRERTAPGITDSGGDETVIVPKSAAGDIENTSGVDSTT